jgi:hypothetical protein
VWSEPPLREEISDIARMQLLPICSRAILKRQRAALLRFELKPMPLASLPDLAIQDLQKLWRKCPVTAASSPDELSTGKGHVRCSD